MDIKYNIGDRVRRVVNTEYEVTEVRQTRDGIQYKIEARPEKGVHVGCFEDSLEVKNAEIAKV